MGLVVGEQVLVSVGGVRRPKWPAESEVRAGGFGVGRGSEEGDGSRRIFTGSVGEGD